MRHVTVAVPATTANLGPGFDSLGAAVSCHLVVASVQRRDQRVVVGGEGAGELPTGDDNLIWRAVLAFVDRFGGSVPDVSLRTAGDIPLERGLGSSSAAIVAGLVVARALTASSVAARELVALADELEGHPDNVAPALLGGFVAAARDDAGRLVLRARAPHARLRPVAYVPAARQATTAARAVLPETLPRADVAAQAARSAHVTGALVGAWPVAPTLAGDLLHEPARLEAMEASGGQLRRLRAAGVHAWLSGAGPSVMAAVPVRAPAPDPIDGFRRLELAWDLRGAVACLDGGCALAGVAAGDGRSATSGIGSPAPAVGSPAPAPRCVHCPRRRV